MADAAAVVSGRRRAVHRLPGDPARTGSCHAGAGVPVDAAELAAIATGDPRRLCAHCYPTRDAR